MSAPDLPQEIQGDLAAAFSTDAELPMPADEVRQTIYGAIAALRAEPALVEAALDDLYWFASLDFAKAAETFGADDSDCAYDGFVDRMIAEATQ